MGAYALSPMAKFALAMAVIIGVRGCRDGSGFRRACCSAGLATRSGYSDLQREVNALAVKLLSVSASASVE
jgi:hypothetical protein